MRSKTLVMSLVVSVGLLLAACGDDDDPSPTQTPNSPGPISGTLPPQSGTASTAAFRTVGELADRIGAAWPGVRSYRSTFATVAGQAATPGPAASSTSSYLIHDEVIVPDRKHRTVYAGDTPILELVALPGRVFLRGSLTQLPAGERVDSAPWTELDPASAATTNQFGFNLGDFAKDVAAPYSALAPDVRQREVTPAGEVTVGDRLCQAYRVTEMTSTGEPIAITISLRADGLPCSIETRAGATVSLTTYDAYNEPLSIEPPPDATPAASPPA